MENLKTIDHKKVVAAYYGKEEFDELYVFVKLNYLLETYPDHLKKWMRHNGFERTIPHAD